MVSCENCIIRIVAKGNFLVISKLIGGVVVFCRVVNRITMWLPDCWGGLTGVGMTGGAGCELPDTGIAAANCFRIQEVCCGQVKDLISINYNCTIEYGDDELTFENRDELCAWWVTSFACVPCPIAPMPGDTQRNAELVAVDGAVSGVVGVYEWSGEVHLETAFYYGESLTFDLTGIPVAGSWSLAVVSPSTPANIPVSVSGATVTFEGYVSAGTSFIISGSFDNPANVAGSLTLSIVAGDTEPLGNSIVGSY